MWLDRQVATGQQNKNAKLLFFKLLLLFIQNHILDAMMLICRKSKFPILILQFLMSNDTKVHPVKVNIAILEGCMSNISLQ